MLVAIVAAKVADLVITVGAGLVRDGVLVALASTVVGAVVVRGVGVGVLVAIVAAKVADLVITVGAGLVRDGILVALANAVVGAVAVRGVSVGMLVAIVAAKVADLVITVGTSLVGDGVLAALASTVVGAVIVGSVLVFVLMGYGSLFERNLYHNALSRHGEGVLAVNGSYNVYIIAFVRSHDEGLPGNCIYFVAFIGGNADGNSFACRGDAGHYAVAAAGGVAHLIVIEYIENLGLSCILLCSKVAYGTNFNEGEQHRHAVLCKHRIVRNRFSIARDSAVIYPPYLCVANKGEVSAIRIYKGHNRQHIVLFDDIAIDAKQEFGVQPSSAAKHFQHISQSIGRETIKSGSNNRIANFFFVTIGHFNRKDCHFNGAVNSACAVHEYGPVVILVKLRV